MKYVLLFTVASLVFATTAFGQEKNVKRVGFLGGYVVKTHEKNGGINVEGGHIILTHEGRLVLTEFDRALVREGLRQGTLKNYSVLQPNYENGTAKKIERQ